MQRRSLPDAGWLLMEGRERPLHVGGLQLFRPPEGADGFLQHLVADLRDQGDVRPPFNPRLARPYGVAGGLYRWVEDEVDRAYRFRHLALPEPGRIRELLALSSRLHASLLDRHRPLWESYLVEGIEHGRFALYTKVHHAVMDGIAAMRQLVRAFGDDPAERDLPAPWGDLARRAGLPAADDHSGVPAAAATLLRSTTGRLTGGLDVARRLATQIAQAQVNAADVAPFQAPPSMLNVRLSGARRLVAQSYELERLRTVGRAVGATLDDVVLARCSGALRDYLGDHGALPGRPLVALVPVSFRAYDATAAGNSSSLVPADLATHLADPEARLELIQASMNRVDERLRGMTATELVPYGIAMTAPLVLGQLTGLAGRGRTTFNVVISDVPGPDHPLHGNGAPMEGLFPFSLLTEGYALNITMTSYDRPMDVGITADRRALPGAQRLIDQLEDALAGLETVAGVRA